MAAQDKSDIELFREFLRSQKPVRGSLEHAALHHMDRPDVARYAMYKYIEAGVYVPPAGDR